MKKKDTITLGTNGVFSVFLEQCDWSGIVLSFAETNVGERLAFAHRKCTEQDFG